MATPTTSSPWGAYCLLSSANHGISILHGWQYVAQKFSRTAFPLKSLRRTSLPSSDFSVKSGAATPCTFPWSEAVVLLFAGAGSVLCLRDQKTAELIMTETATTTTMRTRASRRIPEGALGAGFDGCSAGAGSTMGSFVPFLG